MGRDKQESPLPPSITVGCCWKDKEFFIDYEPANRDRAADFGFEIGGSMQAEDMVIATATAAAHTLVAGDGSKWRHGLGTAEIQASAQVGCKEEEVIFIGILCCLATLTRNTCSGSCTGSNSSGGIVWQWEL